MTVQSSVIPNLVLAQTAQATPVSTATPKSTAAPIATATPHATATALPSAVPSLEDDFLGWTWTGFFIAVVIIAIVYGLRYLESIYRASARNRQKSDGLAVVDERTQRHRRSTIVIFVLIGMVILGLIWIPMVPQLHDQRWVALELAAVGILLSGGFVGFLFGLPRLTDAQPPPPVPGGTATSSPPPSLYQPSTNLEQVVDRIATLLAGVALAQIVAIPGYIAQFADFINKALGNGQIESAQVLASGILLYFAPLGFILSFLCTKTIVAPELARADEALVGLERSKSVIDEFPIWPDVPPDPTPEQQAAAQRIAAVPLSTLITASQKATWGRAQMLLNNLENAILAFQQAQALTPGDPQLLADYAQALYMKDASNASLALSVAHDAEANARPDDYKMRARLRNLIAVCLLYIPGGYEETIVVVNSTLLDPSLALGTRLRFYRACAFGQMWRALAEVNPAPEDLQAKLNAIAIQIINDARISLAYAELREQFILVTIPSGRDEDSSDDDLQAFGRANPQYRSLLGITDPIPAPTTPTPPMPHKDPIQTAASCPP
jgi:hypothetical protein